LRTDARSCCVRGDRSGGETLESEIAKAFGKLEPADRFAIRMGQASSSAIRARVRTCAVLMSAPDVQRLSGDDLERQCSWTEATLKPCVDAVRAGATEESVEACRLADMEYLRDLVVSAHRLRTALHAVDAPRRVPETCTAVKEPATAMPQR
jgi:hypothetical protein